MNLYATIEYVNYGEWWSISIPDGVLPEDATQEEILAWLNDESNADSIEYHKTKHVWGDGGTFTGVEVY